MSSAAPPLPYPAGGSGAYDNGARRPSGTPNGGGERVYRHIHDLQDEAKRGYNTSSSIPQLLEIADSGLSKAQSFVNFRRPDLAFVEYLRASEIIVNVIPRHRDYTHFTYDQQERVGKFKLLTKKIHGMDDQYMKIRDIIKSNNSRNNVLPNGEEPSVRTDSLPDWPLNKSNNGHVSTAGPGTTKVKPIPSPKPDNLHGRALSSSTSSNFNTNQSSGADALSARFAQLRMTRTVDTSQHESTSPSSINSSPISKDTSFDHRSRSSFDSLHLTNSLPARPQGPRAIPNGLPTVDTRFNSNGMALNMPQEPKAAYSPARNMETYGGIAPPRHTARSLESSRRTYSNGGSSVASTYAPNGSSQSGDYFPRAVSGQESQPIRQRASSVATEGTLLKKLELYDIIRRYNVLLIDFRTREEFDYGHIFYRNVICIEPLSIRQGMSADELQESMVLSPELEQQMFFERNEYDQVVYYDGSTRSETYLERPANQREAQLKYLHEALYTFNQDKPLRRAPCLLWGGLEEWITLVGQQGLQSSNTMENAKPGRPIQRRPLATTTLSSNSDLRVPKRRVREYNPLNEEEENYFRERARVESVMLPESSSLVESASDPTDESGYGTGDDSDPSGAIREFIERFPDAGSIDRHAFSRVMPTREPPPPPAKIPMYPSRPEPPGVPPEPARPPPALSRTSYTGVSEPTAKTPTGRSSSGTPYVPAKLVATNYRLPKTGLYNFGATCYMNSTIQALSATTALSVFFLNDGFLSQIQRSNWRSNSKGVMAELYSNLIRSLWKGDTSMIRPNLFRKFCGRVNTTYGNDHVQQDAKEFLEFLLDCLHEDLNTMWSRTPLRTLDEKEEAIRERMPKLVVAKKEWERYLHRDISYVQSLFGGQHLSQLVCQTCHFTSSKYEFFSSLSVEIPDPNRLPGGRIPTLGDCLRSYCAEELLHSSDVWTCPRCKKPRETSKRITITRAPQTLIVHFKRFDHSGSGGNGRKKMVPVDFPLDNLDMGPYMLPSPSAEEARDIARDYGSEALRTDESMTPPYVYDAYAVIRHHGSTLSSGHYTTVVKDRTKRSWLNFNDSRVEDVRSEQMQGSRRLQSQEAYIVFYQRRPMVANGIPEGHF